MQSAEASADAPPTRPTRILLVAADPGLTLGSQGGAGTHLRGTIDALRKQGLVVEAVVGTPESDTANPVFAQRPRPLLRRIVPKHPKLLGRDVRLLLHARSFPRDLAAGFDCVYERSSYLQDSGLRAARAANVPYILETDANLVEYRRDTWGVALPRLAQRFERRKEGAADLVVVLTQAVRNYLVERSGLEPARVLVKGLGVECELFQQPRKPLPERPAVGFAGTFQPYHGVDLLLCAWPHFRGTPPALRLVGDGPRRNELQAEAERLGIAATFTGMVERDRSLATLSDCSVLVIPDSSPYIYPIKLLEYAALGRPVVCPDYPAFDEFDRGQGNTLYRFEPHNPGALARAIEQALAAGVDDRVERLAALVADEYTWDAVGARLAARIRALVRT